MERTPFLAVADSKMASAALLVQDDARIRALARAASELFLAWRKAWFSCEAAMQWQFSPRPERMEQGAHGAPKALIDIQKIYLEPAVADSARGHEILARRPSAERIEAGSHWRIPSLHGNEGLAKEWLRFKRDVLVPGVKKSLGFRSNGRSAHLIAPSTSTSNGWSGSPRRAATSTFSATSARRWAKKR
jgi:hypothetical protein